MVVPMVNGKNKAESADVSVVIPCYNSGRYIEEAVESAQAQTLPPAEILIVNDGSTHAPTLAVLSQLQQRGITVLSTPNRGLPAARNLGIARASSSYILTLDADDKFESGFLEAAVPILDSCSDVGVVTCWLQCFGNANWIWEPKGGGLTTFLAKNECCASSLFRKLCWEQVNGYREEMSRGFEDWDFWIRVTAQGWSVHVIQDRLLWYRKSSGSMSDLITQQQMSDDITAELVRLNSSLFKEHIVDVVRQYTRMLADREQIYSKQANEIRRSARYRVGSWLLAPASALAGLLRRLRKRSTSAH